jgi:CubicO group peptidase (beta-lactamase class C family)
VIVVRTFVLVVVCTLSLMLPTTALAQTTEERRVGDRIDVAAVMKAHGVPGMSVAVIDRGRIVWVKGYGVTAKGGTQPVTPRTLFLAGSISKAVTAVGALVLVQRGQLQLQSDVNERLRSWHVPRNDFTAVRAVTLGELLSHTGGFTGGDFFPGYAAGVAVPSLTQILEGVLPASNDPMRVQYVPGTSWHYSGDGYLVIQQLMMDATGKPFPQLMQQLVFAPMGMHDSTFEQPLTNDDATRAASGTLADGSAVLGGWHVQPEMAAGGLWTTPTDLAKLAIAIVRAANGATPGVLSQQMALGMLDAHWTNGVVNILGTPASPDAMGYGFFVGAGHRFGHIGGNVGYQATMVVFGDAGKGAVIMTNSDIGLQAGNELLDAIAQAYGWNYVAPSRP